MPAGNFALVPQAYLAPFKCATCAETRGEMVDTGVDDPMYGGRVYLCKRVCARGVSRVCGFAPGKKLEELSRSAELLADAEKSLEEQQATLARLRGDLLSARREAEEMAVLAEQRRGRIVQLEAAISDEARKALALVTGGAA